METCPYIRNIELDALGLLYYHKRDVNTLFKVLLEEGKKYYPHLIYLANDIKEIPADYQQFFIGRIYTRENHFSKLFLSVELNSFSERVFKIKRMIIRPQEQLNTSLKDQVRWIMKNWAKNQLKSHIIKVENDKLLINTEKAEDLLYDLKKLNSELNPNTFRKRGIQLIEKVLDYNGITMPSIAFTDLVNHTLKWTNGSSLASDFNGLFHITKNGLPKGVFSTIILKLNGIKNKMDYIIENELKLSEAINNPIFTEKTAMRILAKPTIYYAPTVDDSLNENIASKIDLFKYYK